jgi:hypothetical protein
MPPNPWGKKPQIVTSSSGFPGLKPSNLSAAPSPSPSPVPKSQYAEIQEDELIALSSIYGEDFRQIQTNNVAWKVSVEENNYQRLAWFFCLGRGYLLIEMICPVQGQCLHSMALLSSEDELTPPIRNQSPHLRYA